MSSTLYLAFKKSHELFPKNICLQDQTVKLTYETAYKHINEIASSLYSKAIKAHDIVAFYGDKSIDSILVFLALSKLGITCLTLDLAFPNDMIDFVLDDASVDYVICNKSLPLSTKQEVFFVNDLRGASTEHAPTYTNNFVAWLVYSSGTTGKPKGINLSSDAIYNSILSRAKYSGYHPNDKIACNIYFYWEAFRPLFFGATLCIVPDELLFNLSDYANYISEEKITETLWTPSFAQMLFSALDPFELEKINKLKRVWLNGEVVQRSLANDLLSFLPNVNCFNLYSISETFDVSAKLIEPLPLNDGSDCVSIGFPLSGVHARVLNEQGALCEPLEIGELYLESHSLAKGYLNRPQAQKESFVIINDKRCYRTKDQGFQSAEGEIFILGRNDNVVKLRGYNVSLLAIENALKEQLEIKHCAVLLEGADAVSQRLVAVMEPENYDDFTTKYEANISAKFLNNMQSISRQILPEYSIPQKFIVKKVLTLDAYSAKLDRKKIRNEMSHDKLIALWQTVLCLEADALDANSHFFELGANSLESISLMQKIKQTFGFAMTMEDLYEHPTLSALRQFITSKPANEKKPQINYDQDIIFNCAKKPRVNGIDNLSQASRVFITGVTGFLGAHWLARCLEKTTATYYCFVRAADKRLAFERLKSAFENYQLDPKLLDDRVEMFTGCLTENQLGLKDEEWAFLLNEIELVLHAAAYVNLIYPYQKLKSSIVDGAKQLLALATTVRLKPVIIISSDAVFPLGDPKTSNDFLDETTFPKLTYGYAQAKWVQERLIKKVFDAYQLPFLLVRLGNLAPSLKSGIANKEDANRYFCQVIRKHKKIPEKALIEFSFVDDVVNFLMARSSEKIKGSIFSLNNINHINSSALKELMPSWALETISNDAWLALLEESEPELFALWTIEELFSEQQLKTNNKLPELRASKDNKINLLTLLSQGEI